MSRVHGSTHPHVPTKSPSTPEAARPKPAAAPAAPPRKDGFRAGGATPMTTLRPSDGRPLASPRIQPAWVGNTAVEIAREPSARPQPAESFTFDTWARQRAGTTQFNFEVWAPGVTDKENPDLWQQLDVEMHYRYSGQTEWKTDYVSNDFRSGNNAHYSVDLRKYDPWSSGGISVGQPNPSVPISETKGPDGRVSGHEAKLEFFFTVNGKQLEASNGKPFEGTYQNY